MFWYCLEFDALGHPGAAAVKPQASKLSARRDKAAAAWKALIPSGELPKDKPDGTKTKP